jgi:predicted nucleotidyltransferase
VGGEAVTAVDLLSPPNADAVARGIDQFAAVAKERYGSALKGLYLFGSRARGDFSPFSDVDLAIVVDESIDVSSETVPLSAAAYDILVETGAEIQPWAFHESEWADPTKSSSPGLLRSAKRDSVAVGVTR